jgi:hypothetical protein
MSQKEEAQRIPLSQLAIRIILLKTLPGLEFRVFHEYKRHLDTLGDVKAWWCYKIFGAYDLCFIIVRDNLLHDMLTSGTIDGITYSTEVLCYQWGPDDIDAMKKNFSKSPLIGLDIIKIEPSVFLSNIPDVVEEDFFAGVSEELKEILCLGTFGWGEFILLFPTDSFAKIYSQFICKAHEYAKDRETSLFIKSFSLIGINYQVLMSDNLVSTLMEPISDNNGIYPSVYVSCRASDMRPLRESLWDLLNQRKVKAANIELLTFGRSDFVLEVKGGKWGQFIDGLLAFREKHRRSIFKTSVQLYGHMPFPTETKKSYFFSPYTIHLSPDGITTLKRLGQPLDETIISTIYTFNQYLRNELLFDSVEEMFGYVEKLRFLALDVTQLVPLSNKRQQQKYLEAMPELIRLGCYHRLAGFSLEEGSEDFSSYKGGKQRVLKALKAFCKDIIDSVLRCLNIPVKWDGFVIIGRHPSYSHYHDVLTIPIDATFSVEKYFGLFHEIGHLFLLLQDEDHKKIDLNRIKGSAESRFVEEIFCDLFDFQCGFLGDYTLYMDSVMTYVASVVRRDFIPDEIKKYSIRLLAVMNYWKISLNKDTEIRSEAFNCLSRFFSILGYDNTTLRDEILGKFDEAGDELTLIIKSFRYFFETHLASTFHAQRIALFNDPSYQQQFAKILSGETVPDLQHPHLVVLSMLKHKDLITFRTQAAAIRSFINVYYNKGWSNIGFFYEHPAAAFTHDVMSLLLSGASVPAIADRLSRLPIPQQLAEGDFESYDDIVREELHDLARSLKGGHLKRLGETVLGHLIANGIIEAGKSTVLGKFLNEIIRFVSTAVSNSP